MDWIQTRQKKLREGQFCVAKSWELPKQVDGPRTQQKREIGLGDWWRVKQFKSMFASFCHWR